MSHSHKLSLPSLTITYANSPRSLSTRKCCHFRFLSVKLNFLWEHSCYNILAIQKPPIARMRFGIIVRAASNLLAKSGDAFCAETRCLPRLFQGRLSSLPSTRITGKDGAGLTDNLHAFTVLSALLSGAYPFDCSTTSNVPDNRASRASRTCLSGTEPA